MPLTCCVPGCRGNYRETSKNPLERVSVFRFPKDSEMREKWIKMIPRSNLNLTSRTVVCEKHFIDSFIVRVDTAKRADGSILSVPRTHPKLTDDAYPSIFPNTPSYLTSQPPAKRKKPDVRRAEQADRDEACFEEWMAKDVICSYVSLTESVSDVLKDHKEWASHFNDNRLCFYKLNFDNIPVITVSVCVDCDLAASVYRGSILQSKESLSWILGKEMKLCRYSQLSNLLSHFNDVDKNIELGSTDYLFLETKVTFKRLVDKLADDCNNILEDTTCRLTFLYEQLVLLFSKQKRYSTDTVVSAFHLMCLSSSSYNHLRESLLHLPHPSYLRKLTKTLNVSNEPFDNGNLSYLKNKFASLAGHEKIVTLLLDEIHVAPQTKYKAGVITGLASNVENDEATTVQAFMIQSLLSNKKDIVALIPVKNLNMSYLKECTVKILELLETIGYKVLCCISDNNRVNRNMFTDFCNGHLFPSIGHPCDPSRRLFFLFDSVHLMKCIRNNWLGQSDRDKTFIVPEFDSNSAETIPLKASFVHLNKLQALESNSLTKLAPSLTYKALCPTSLERQSVTLALKIFDEKVPVALKDHASELNSNFDGTAVFIQLINKLWKILNVKSVDKGIRKRDENSKPISSIDDKSVLFLKEFSSWLDRWDKMGLKPRQGRLSNETFFALKHTVDTFISLIDYLLNVLKFSYVITGKFQTDCLEARFGKYRQMSGANYNVSVQEIQESEKKLRVLQVLKVVSKSYGEITFTDFVCDHNEEDIEGVHFDIDFSHFDGVINMSCDQPVNSAENKALVFITGYLVFKCSSRVSCQLCLAELSSKTKMDLETVSSDYYSDYFYLAALDRGGLKWPTDFLLDVVTACFKVFSSLVSKEFESKFLSTENQLKLFIELCLMRLKVCNIISDITCECGRNIIDLVRICIRTLGNIFLNNYCKRAADKRVFGKKLSRKLSTLNK